MHLIDLAGANLSETSPSAIDIAKMESALLSSIPSRLHCYGNDDVQLEVLEGSMQRNDLLKLGKGVYTQPSQCQCQSQSETLIYDYNHQLDSLYGIPSRKDISQQSLLLDKDPFRSQYEGVCGKARKRPFEYTDNMPLWKKMKSNSKNIITIMQQKWSQTKEVPEMIPPHKTDTASVLHEASINIKLLQAQIRTLFQMLSFSYVSTIKVPHTQECGDQLQLELRSRGLCLVPISITEKVTMADQIHHYSASRIIHS
ncbi:hypothetical protein Fmac_017196 [Flemingia macrophylla]|uniref:Uncharacterized protein n=1 Tax=Flemingia macrophylla TaxID=520843 RepID=A0ABD1M3A8_9FABA